MLQFYILIMILCKGEYYEINEANISDFIIGIDAFCHYAYNGNGSNRNRMLRRFRCLL